jgi:hypothetical protein
MEMSKKREESNGGGRESDSRDPKFFCVYFCLPVYAGFLSKYHISIFTPFRGRGLSQIPGWKWGQWVQVTFSVWMSCLGVL